MENKLKIKLQLHLGTEFEYTRLVDKKGQKIDPFVPKYDIMKIQDLSKDVKKSQKIYVQSPRFIKTLERALIAILDEADTENTGELSYQEFYDGFKKLQNYELSQNDLRTLLALADENENGKITWRDFIPHGINAIQNFLERNKQSAKKKDEEKLQMKPELLKVLYEHEIKKVTQIMQKRFEAFDTDKETKKHSGLISFDEMQVCLKSTSHLTPKEINALLREYVMTQGKEQINYTNFADDLYKVRFELIDSRIMDMNMDTLDKIICDACAEASEDGKNINLTRLTEILQGSKQLVLTPFQVSLLLGYSNPDKDANVDFATFAKVCAEKIRAMFKVEAQRRKAQLVAVGQFRLSDVKMPPFNNDSIFAAFREHDRDYNCFLEWHEYQQCLEKLSELNLTSQEALSINLVADVDGNGRIDYQEFMKHFHDIMFLLKFTNELQAHYDELPERLQERMQNAEKT